MISTVSCYLQRINLVLWYHFYGLISDTTFWAKRKLKIENICYFPLTQKWFFLDLFVKLFLENCCWTCLLERRVPFLNAIAYVISPVLCYFHCINSVKWYHFLDWFQIPHFELSEYIKWKNSAIFAKLKSGFSFLFVGLYLGTLLEHGLNF